MFGLLDQGWEGKGNSLLTGGYGRLNYLVNGYRDAHCRRLKDSLLDEGWEPNSLIWIKVYI